MQSVTHTTAFCVQGESSGFSGREAEILCIDGIEKIIAACLGKMAEESLQS